MLALALAAAVAAAPDTAPIDCGACADWNAAQSPFRIHGNSYYVGPRGLGAVLIATRDGLILLDGALPQSAEPIAKNIETLGFRLSDVKWIVNSHAHYDHAGGIAALARMSGAQVVASPRGAQALRAGTVPADDPQSGYGEAMRFPPVAEVVELADGESIALGEVTLTAHHTPGHTPGSTTWTWRSCDGDDCLPAVYADSLTAVSSPGFRFSDDPARVAQFRRSIDSVRHLDCGVLVSTHPGFSGLFDKLAAQEAGQADAFVDPAACRNYADAGERWLDKRLAEEAGAAPSR